MALQPVDNPPPRKRRFTISLRFLMLVGFGGLVALSVGGVLAMSVYANFVNTLTLLNHQAIQLIDGMEQLIERDAQEGERVVSSMAELYAQGGFEISDKQALEPIMKTLLLAEPIVETLIVVGKGGERFGLAREPNNRIIEINPPADGAPQRAPADAGTDRRAPPAGAHSSDDSRSLRQPPPGNPGSHRERPHPRSATGDPGAESDAPSFQQPPPPGDGPAWREPQLINGILFHTVSHALQRDGRIDGMVVASVGAHSLNRAVMQIGEDSDTAAFIANDGGDIIAHSHQPHLFQNAPSILPAEFPDQAIRAFASGLDSYGDTGVEGIEIGGTVDADQNEHIFISKEITAMSSTPYKLITYFDAARMGAELERIFVSAVIGVVAFLLAVTLALLFSNRLSRPLRRISNSASQFARLDLADYKPLPHSPVREIDEQTSAMNAMHTALSEFGQYVPRELVRRLLESGTEATRSVEREITVMFTDVAGFTAMSERMSAVDVVQLLNEHFDVQCTEITRHQGTVDKFMGDGLMAFWGAPQSDPSHARHAIEAAAAIAAAFKVHNRKREQAGLKPLGLRMGLHTGRAVVGNIGGADRHNYTVIGDIVNVAARLEQLGKDLGKGQDIVACISADCRAAAGNPDNLVPAGSHVLRGRSEPIAVFTLAFDNTGETIEDARETA